jgi:hypothetical protein
LVQKDNIANIIRLETAKVRRDDGAQVITQTLQFIATEGGWVGEGSLILEFSSVRKAEAGKKMGRGFNREMLKGMLTLLSFNGQTWSEFQQFLLVQQTLNVIK